MLDPHRARVDHVLTLTTQVRRSADDADQLPLTYDPDAIASYWERRPVSIITRITQVGGGCVLETVLLLGFWGGCPQHARYADSMQAWGRGQAGEH